MIRIKLKISWSYHCTKATSFSTAVFYYMTFISVQDITHLTSFTNYSNSKFFYHII